MRFLFLLGLSIGLVTPITSLHAQDATSEAEPAVEAETSDALLTQAALENLVAPVALYPDTLLIQILVAATYPLEVMKADRFLLQNADLDPETLQTEIEAQAWDDSVAVLATAFPDVITDMAEHVEWTETMGTAMLAQSDDVLNAVQTMRDQAINSGALISGEAQTVSTDEEDNVVITPTDPEVVYVPEYDPNVVYNNTVTDALVTGAVAFGTFAVMDAIFDDDDDWNDYWGCRNCGGWGGGDIIVDPDVDIDIDGDVNIGNRPEAGWKPDPNRKGEAQNKISERRDANGGTKLPIDKPSTRPSVDRGDDLRNQLSSRTGAADISRPGSSTRLPQVNRNLGGGGGNLPQVQRPSTRPSADKAAAIRNTGTRPAASKKPAVKKPAAAKPTLKKAKPKKTAVKKRAPAGKTKAASNRGKVGKLKAGR